MEDRRLPAEDLGMLLLRTEPQNPRETDVGER